MIKCKWTLHSFHYIYIDRVMLIKAITLFRIRAVGDFLAVCHFKTKYWHTQFSPNCSRFTLRYKLYLSEYSSSQLFYFTCFMCIWSFGRTKTQKCPLLVSFRARAHAHTRTHTHTHTHIHGEQRLSCGFYFQRFIIIHVQQFSNCKDVHGHGRTFHLTVGGDNNIIIIIKFIMSNFWRGHK